MANYVKKSERDVKAIARGHGRSMVKVLAGIATNADAQPSARVAAANALLDRGFGKPEQHTSMDVKHDVTSFLREIQGITLDNEPDQDDEGPAMLASNGDPVIDAQATVTAGQSESE